MFKIQPIGTTIIDKNPYLEITREVLGKNVVGELEDKGIGIDDNSGYLRSLCDFLPLTLALNHIHYSFLVIGDKGFWFRLMQHQCYIAISLVDSKREDCYLGLMSGSLGAFRNFILSTADGDEDMEIRAFSNMLQDFFESKEGLYQAFRNMFKRKMPDGTLMIYTHKGLQS